MSDARANSLIGTLDDHYRRSNQAAALDPPLPLEDARRVDDRWGDVTTEPGGVDYLEISVRGVPAMWLIPHGSPDDHVLLCIHGGGYIGGSIYTHRKLFGHIAKAVGVRALSIDYRRVPEHRHPAALDDVTTAYGWLLDEGFDSDRIAFVGDSAGGGLALAASLRLRDQGRPLPAALLPMSPWTDLTLGGNSHKTNLTNDIEFGGETPMNLELLVMLLLGPDGDREDPSVSPLFGDLSGLPPTYIQVGDAEMLLDDSTRFAEQARNAGIDIRLDIFPGGQHTFQMAAGNDPRADKAIAELAAWVKPIIGL